MFRRAIVRQPGRNFAEGLTSVDLGTPDYDLALAQHNAYCEALEHCGLALARLVPDERYPDSAFVEDTAVLTQRCAVVTRPGAVSRTGEVEGMTATLSQFYPRLHSVTEPGTVDGGDVCEAGNHFFIGLSARTNETGARQLAELLFSCGYTSSLIDIGGMSNILHLKSGLSYLGDNRLVLIEGLADREDFRAYSLIRVSHDSEHAANCVRVNDCVLVAAGFPQFEEQLRELDYRTVVLEMSEFQKMDGGLSCLSLRF